MNPAIEALVRVNSGNLPHFFANDAAGAAKLASFAGNRAPTLESDRGAKAADPYEVQMATRNVPDRKGDPASSYFVLLRTVIGQAYLDEDSRFDLSDFVPKKLVHSIFENLDGRHDHHLLPFGIRRSNSVDWRRHWTTHLSAHIGLYREMVGINHMIPTARARPVLMGARPFPHGEDRRYVEFIHAGLQGAVRSRSKLSEQFVTDLCQDTPEQIAARQPQSLDPNFIAAEADVQLIEALRAEVGPEMAPPARNLD